MLRKDWKKAGLCGSEENARLSKLTKTCGYGCGSKSRRKYFLSFKKGSLIFKQLSLLNRKQEKKENMEKKES
jgi:hypothetical protein